MRKSIFKLDSTLQKFISSRNLLGKPQGEKNRRYLADFTVNAFQSENDQSYDDGSNCGPSLQRNPVEML